MKRLWILLVLALILPVHLHAKSAEKIWQEFETAYLPADDHPGLWNAHEKPDPSKLRTFVVIMKGGIPAERAAFYISWGDYDYRGATIDGDKLTTRTGKVYTFLKTGDIMTVSDISRVGRTIYMKLLSPEVYIPENRAGDKRHSRVTTTVVFKLPKDIYKADDPQRALEVLGEWFRPFKNFDEAKTFASSLAQKE